MRPHKHDATTSSSAADSTAPNMDTRRGDPRTASSSRRPHLPTTRKPEFRIQRIYEHEEDPRGYRVLVDRLWPRGVTRQEAALDEWAKDVAPSAELRRW